jgi:RND family efflux transporter MFP subunit
MTEHDPRDERPARTSRKLVPIAAVLLVIVSLVVLAALLYKRNSNLGTELREREAKVKAGPRVHVVPATRASVTRTMTFVGEARPFLETTLYSKVSGYLSVINVDKGDKVTSGQVLAIIQSPELDRQYAAAVADATSKRLVAQRNNLLLSKGSIAPQTAELSEAAAKTAEETAAALLAQKDYEVMRAPFSGVITARYVDPGSLIQNAISGQTNAQPVVTLSQTDQLRVYVYPDQRSASLVQTGDPASISDAARPDVKVSGAVSRTSGRLDQKTRSLLVEIDVNNSDGKIIPGSFVQVDLKIRTAAHTQIPADALVIKGNKSLVATLTQDDTVAFKEVSIYSSNGTTVRLGSGLTEGEQVITNPGQSLKEGQTVRPVRPQYD